MIIMTLIINGISVFTTIVVIHIISNSITTNNSMSIRAIYTTIATINVVVITKAKQHK